jgi:hypothetical protein
VDQEDFGHIQACLSGSALRELGCENADFDGDLTVDDEDLDMFYPCMAGAGREPGC